MYVMQLQRKISPLIIFDLHFIFSASSPLVKRTKPHKRSLNVIPLLVPPQA